MTPNIPPKTLAWSLAGFVSAGLILGILLIRNDLHSPFRIADINLSANSNVAVIDEDGQLLALRDKDTDGDGLSDYDELYAHNTSPYLRDSDSDGDSDGNELAGGQDPNCPKGQVCETFPATNTVTNAGLTNDLNGNIDVIGELRNVDIATLRQTLLNAGAPKEALDQMTDDQLRQLYDEILSEQAGGLNLNVNGVANQPANTPTNTNRTTISQQDLANLTPAEIRQFLIASGIDPNTINSVDDQTLQQIFQQAIAESNSRP